MTQLDTIGAKHGDRVRVTLSDGSVHEGRYMPTHAFSEPGITILKLDNGYNIGLQLDDAKTELVEKAGNVQAAPSKPIPRDDSGLPRVAMLGTGGTIASYVDYRTGAVWPATEPETLAALVPEMFELARVEPKIVFKMFSEDMQPAEWQKLAEECAAAFDDGATGVVIPHGTDTLSYTATALAFMLPKLPGPVVLVGAQRSSDRPSSDAAMNLMGAVRVAATSDIGEVVVVMHDESDDTRLGIHRGTRVRKMHTSRRDAFRSINDTPIGYIDGDKVLITGRVKPATPRNELPDGKTPTALAMNEDVSMIQSYPGLSPEHILDVVRDGTVLVGTGLGHVARRCLDAVRAVIDRGAHVVMTSQCYYGRVDMHVYSTGRDLLNTGVISGEDMQPEVAYIKLMWVLGQTQDPHEVRRMMETNLRGEMDPRTRMETYLS